MQRAEINLMKIRINNIEIANREVTQEQDLALMQVIKEK